MMIKYIKQFGIWYLILVLYVLLYLLTFRLYQLPMMYLLMASLFNLLLIFPFGVWHYLKFVRQMTLVEHFRDIREIAELSSPLDKVYQKQLSKLIEETSTELFHVQNRMKGQQDLVKMWSHQMKVPLSALSLMAQTEELDRKELRKQLLRLEHYLETLLTYLKFSNQKDDYRFEFLSAESLVKSIIKKYSLFFINKGLSVTVQGDWLLKSDKKWFSFALNQIIDNAIKYSNKGGTITIAMSETGIKISDQGMGILPEDLPRLFEEGFTGYNGHEHQKASGFGLYMTKQVLDQLNMTIEITSQIGKGTDVLIFQETGNESNQEK